MKKATNDGMPEEIDFSKAVRGKYAKRFALGSNIVMIKPEICAALPGEQAVNNALELVMRSEAKNKVRAPRRRPVAKALQGATSR